MVRERQKILIIDDTPANIQVLNEFLRAEYAIFFATNGGEGIRIARRELPDLILLDIMMPEMDGYAVCRIIKADPHTRQIPVIFVTAMDSQLDEARGLELGAIDYITKPVSPTIVKARVRNHLELKRHRDMLGAMTVELERKNRELALLAREDSLTGLANRRQFDAILAAEIKRARRFRQILSLIMCDVDHFKNYNDHYGHPAGDECLRTIGRILSGVFKRASDLPARYGGEEFAVIFPDTPPGNAAFLAEKLRSELAEHAIPHACSDAAGFVTLSLGVVSAHPCEERTASWFISEADKALYRAKESGRNRVVMASYD